MACSLGIWLDLGSDDRETSNETPESESSDPWFEEGIFSSFDWWVTWCFPYGNVFNIQSLSWIPEFQMMRSLCEGSYSLSGGVCLPFRLCKACPLWIDWQAVCVQNCPMGTRDPIRRWSCSIFCSGSLIDGKDPTTRQQGSQKRATI